MSLVIAVKSCQAHRPYHQAIRDTWGKKFSHVVFYMGGGPASAPLQPDEVVLYCDDDYMSLPHKTRAILHHAQSLEYTHIFLCDNDTFINPHEFSKLDYNYDYSGHINGLCPIGETTYYEDHMGKYPKCHPWASGGIGYFLSRKAGDYLVSKTPNVWAEDLWVGQEIGAEVQAGRMTEKHLDNFNRCAAWHFARTKKYRMYNPEMMYRSWKLGNPDLMYEEDRVSR
jgi:hypothetical protein